MLRVASFYKEGLWCVKFTDWSSYLTGNSRRGNAHDSESQLNCKLPKASHSGLFGPNRMYCTGWCL